MVTSLRMVWKYGDQIAMGKVNSGGPMFCEWKSDISKQSLEVCEFKGVVDITYGASERLAI